MIFFKRKTITILSIDGGGIRGIIPLYLLREINHRLCLKKKIQSFASLFNLMTGSSTGALIVLGLAAPQHNAGASGDTHSKSLYTFNDIIKLYTKKGDIIFHHDAFEQFRYMTQGFRDKYSVYPLEHILNDVFGTIRLQQALTGILIPAYELYNKTPFYFKKTPVKKGNEGEMDFFMKDVARAATAAPTYFNPASIASLSPVKKRYCFIDGVVFDNNPAMSAYIEARKMYPGARRFIIISVGTGSTLINYDSNKVKKWGYFDWISPLQGAPLSSIMIDGQIKCVNQYLAKLPDVEYYRIDDRLEGCSVKIDDASRKNLHRLKKHSFSLIKKYSSVIDVIVQRLSNV
jgi:hypothetical protein